MSTMQRWSVRSTPENTFRSLMAYLIGRHFKIVSRSKPWHVRVEIGSWFSFVDEGNAKGELEAKIVRENGGSRIYLNLDFAKEYSLGFFAVLFGILAFAIMGAIFSSALVALLGSTIISALVVTSEIYSVSNTRKKVSKEFDTLMQLLASN